MPLSCVSAGDVDQGRSGKIGGHWIFVTVYGALARKVGDMPSSALENDRLVVLPATINVFAFNGDSDSGGGSGTVCAIAFADGRGCIGEQEDCVEVA